MILSSPAWGWLLIALGNVALMHDWIFSPTIGPFIGAGVAFLLVLGALHFLRYHPAGP